MKTVTFTFFRNTINAIHNMAPICDVQKIQGWEQPTNKLYWSTDD